MTTLLTSLKADLLRELACRKNAVAIPALVEDYGREVLAVLKDLRRERKVRLVACGVGIGMWCEREGYSREDCIEGESEWFVEVEAR